MSRITIIPPRIAGVVWLSLAAFSAAATGGASSGQARLSADYDAITRYDFGESRQALAVIEDEIRDLPNNLYPEVESRLLDVLKGPQVSFAARQFVCRMLRQVGSARCVPALAELLADRNLSHMARFALQALPAPEAGAALRAAVTTLEGDLRIGVIGSLGQRRDRLAVGLLAPLTASDDRNTASAAIAALGRIGGGAAADVLAAARVPAALEAAREDARLMCADSLLAEGKRERAVAIYRELTGEEHVTWIRIAAYRGLVLAEPTDAIAAVSTLLKDDSLDLQRAAATIIMRMPGSAVTLALAEQLGVLDVRAQVLLLSALETRADKSALPYVARILDTADAPVQLAAIQALGTLGDRTSVSAVASASARSPEARRAARESLARLSGPGVTEAVMAVAQGHGAAAVRVTMVEVLVDRRATAAIPRLCDMARGPDGQVRRAVLAALGELAGPDEIPFLVDLLLEPSSLPDGPAIERALVSIAARTEGVSAAPLVSGLARADAAASAHLLAVLAVVGSDPALAAVRARLGHGDPTVQTAAVRALSRWPGPAALPDLMAVCREAGGDPSRKILALRGYIQLVGLPANRGAARTVALLEEAMAVAARVDERRAILSELAKHPCTEALTLAQKAAEDPALGAEAAIALKKIDEALARRQLSARASLNEGNVKNALDGRRETRWDTGRGMKPGDWFVLDLGVEATVRGITLDARDSENDYPRGYEVYVSFDGGRWGDPIVTGKEGAPLTEIPFATPIRARYIKIVQTGSSDSWYWSIHELNVEFISWLRRPAGMKASKRRLGPMSTEHSKRRIGTPLNRKDLSRRQAPLAGFDIDDMENSIMVICPISMFWGNRRSRFVGSISDDIEK